MWVIGTHLFFRLIFLITPMHQAIICNKDIIQVRCQEVGNRNTHGFPHVRRGGILQDTVCQHHPGGFSPNLPIADLAKVNTF